jgi:hypothetical protein
MPPVRYEHTICTAIVIMAVFLVSLGRTFPTHAQNARATASEHGAVAAAQEPPVLKTIITAHWRLANARAALPPVPLVVGDGAPMSIVASVDGCAMRRCNC